MSEIEKAPGCSVMFEMICTNEHGQMISDYPKRGGWHGFDRKRANALAMDINEAITKIIEGYNEAVYGPDYRNKGAQTPPKNKV